MDILSTENQILMLHEHLVCPGFYVLNVSTQQQGRQHLAYFLRFFFRRPMCLTAQGELLPERVLNIAHELDLDFLFLQNSYEFKQRILEFAWGDFIWIEVTDELQQKPWFAIMMSLFNELSMQVDVPMLSMIIGEEIKN